jgi:hypothetical protein
MAMIFPGMDPWLEDPQLWPGVHSRLVVYLADQLQGTLGSRYFAAVEERVYLEAPPRQIIPDVWIRRRPQRDENGGTAVAAAATDDPIEVDVPPLEIHQPYIEILDRHSGQRVVTVIEVASPTNKSAGVGRESYQSKQQEVWNSTAHLVEVDLLRGGEHVVAVPEWVARDEASYDYLTCVNRVGKMRSKFELYPCAVPQRLPRIRIPLAGEDLDVRLDLQAAVAQVYDAGSYRDRIDYGQSCRPPLSEEHRRWAESIVKAANVNAPDQPGQSDAR